MKDHGIDSVRVLEFAWSRMERADGQFDFAWVHRFLGLIREAGLGVMPCTPTAAPPAWLVRDHPECAVMDANRHRAAHGARRHYCPTSRVYRNFGNRITRRMQEELSRYDNVLLWQLDNEFGGNVCYCPECNLAFRESLRARYLTEEKLNEAMGGAFWSEDCWDWRDVEIPRAGNSTVVGGASPEMRLAFSRFFSDQTIDFMKDQLRCLRAAGCEAPIGTNLMGDFDQIDYWKLAEPLDLVGFDNYFDIYTLAGNSLAHNLIRSLKGGKGYWTFENQVDCLAETMPTPPGFNICHALSGFAHGEVGHTYFRWDSCRFGQGQDLQGLVDWSGRPRYKLNEVAELRSILDEMTNLKLPPLETPIALVFSYPNNWNHTVRYFGNYWDEIESFYQAIFDCGFVCDCVPSGGDLSRYRLVLAPGLQLVSSAELENFRSYVWKGGTLVAGRKTFSKGESGSYLDSSHPALSDVFGMRVVETHNNVDRNDIAVRGFWGKVPEISFRMKGLHGLSQARSKGWYETLELTGAEALYTYEDGYFPDEPASSRHRFGKGIAYYLGTSVGRDSMREFIQLIFQDAKISPALDVPQGMQVVRRGNTWMVTNPSKSELTLRVPFEARALLGAKPEGQGLTLPPCRWSLLEVGPGIE